VPGLEVETVTAFDPVKKCNVCHRTYVRRGGGMYAACPECSAVFDNMRGLRRGECKTDHPDLEARIAEYGRRADAGLPLFGE
jgi:hypothetical protein